ncbi:hypothetical protein MMAD_36100 [Mycolicibacterium madagascariense]|uniref:Transposase n=1 Tax=Mycolicibacterium madagascariense TaxID=212765 RepID=A0A7I7XJM2_9MYCO|nr:hypothetical protein MMAD_36100 [Mycolicibacterium madagascariense]
MPKAFPEEFRRDVIAVARKGEASIRQVAKDFGISEACLHRWLKIADREDGASVPVALAGLVTSPRSCAKPTNGSSSWSRKRRSCAVPWAICPEASTQNDVPAGP